MKTQLLPGRVLSALLGVLALNAATALSIAHASVEPQAIIPAATIPAAKLSSDGAPADINGAVITAAFTDSFYIQADMRQCGILVKMTSHGLQAGARSHVIGTVKTNGVGERFIDASTAAPTGLGSAQPLGMRGRNIGGAGWNYSSVTGAGQQGVAGGFGLNNVGLLVQTAGRVTSSARDHFYVDDGSGASDSSSSAGVRVDAAGLTTIPPAGGFVTVTGISSVFSFQPGGALNRLILPRGDEDVKTAGVVLSGTVSQSAIVTSSASVDSPHPTPDNYNNTWDVNGPAGSTRMRVHFATMELDALDSLYVQDRYGNTQQQYDFFSYSFPLSDVWSNWIGGNSVGLNLVTEYTYYYTTARYGFEVDQTQADTAGAPIPGVTVTLTPGGQTTVTGSDGRYAFADLAAGNYTLTPSIAGASFNPPSATVSAAADQYISGIDFHRN